MTSRDLEAACIRCPAYNTRSCRGRGIAIVDVSVLFTEFACTRATISGRDHAIGHQEVNVLVTTIIEYIGFITER